MHSHMRLPKSHRLHELPLVFKALSDPTRLRLLNLLAEGEVCVCFLGDVSGAHLNPAVTIAFATAGRFPFRQVPAYIAGQCLGALAASGLLRLLFPAHTTLGATLPAGSELQSLILEAVLTAMLMFVI